MCQNSLFPSRGTINNICITTAPRSQSYLLPSAASDNRGPPRAAFADHPVHVLFLGTSTPGPSLPTAQAPAGAQGQSVQSSRRSVASSTAPSSLHLSPPWSAELGLAQSPQILLLSHFCFLQQNRNSEVKYQHHLTGFVVSSSLDGFIFFQSVAAQSQVEGEAGL